MQKKSYGERINFGWNIDHDKPKSKDGTNDIDNLFPMQWQNNTAKGNDFPEWKGKMTYDSSKSENIETTIRLKHPYGNTIKNTKKKHTNNNNKPTIKNKAKNSNKNPTTKNNVQNSTKKVSKTKKLKVK